MAYGMTEQGNNTASNESNSEHRISRRNALIGIASSTILPTRIVGASDEDPSERTVDVVRGVKNGETTYEKVSQDWAQHIDHVTEVKERLAENLKNNPQINQIGLTSDKGNYIAGHKRAKIFIGIDSSVDPALASTQYPNSLDEVAIEHRQEGELELHSCQTDNCGGGANSEYDPIYGGSIHQLDDSVSQNGYATICCAVQHDGETKYLTTMHQWADGDCNLEGQAPREAYQMCKSSNSAESERNMGQLSDFNQSPDWSVIESTIDRCPGYTNQILYKDYDPYAGEYWDAAAYNGIVTNYSVLMDNDEGVVKIGANTNEYEQSSIRDWNVTHSGSCSQSAPAVQLETTSLGGDSGGPYYTTDGREPDEIVGMNLGSLSGSNYAVGVESERLHNDGIDFYGTY